MAKVTKIQDLSVEQQKRVVNAESPKEIVDYLQDEGLELTDEQLEIISGGGKTWDDMRTCAQSG